MYWLLQNKFEHDSKYRELVHNLDRLSVSYSFCNVIPFSEDGIEFLDDETYNNLKDKSIFTYGSYTLAKIAKKYFKPASFISDNISINYLLENYKDEMFNSDMVIGPIKDIDTDMKEFFIRPLEDTKSFCGELMNYENFISWKNKIIESSKTKGYSTITEDTMVSIASKKRINKEYRFFIVNKKIATCSQYRLNGQAYFLEGAEEYIKDYVYNMINNWSPDYAFCIDIAVTDNIPKILEINCINASGMYAIDTQKFIIAIEELNNIDGDYIHSINLTT